MTDLCLDVRLNSEEMLRLEREVYGSSDDDEVEEEQGEYKNTTDNKNKIKNKEENGGEEEASDAVESTWTPPWNTMSSPRPSDRRRTISNVSRRDERPTDLRGRKPPPKKITKPNANRANFKANPPKFYCRFEKRVLVDGE